MKQQPLLEGEAPKQDALERAMSPMEMLQMVLQNQNPKDAVEVVKELVKLQNEMRLQDATVAFNDRLAACQKQIKVVINDSDKTSPGGKRWASLRALDKAVRPIFEKMDFSLSFGSQPSSVPDQMIAEAYLSLGLYSRTYAIPMDIGGKGPKGDGALSKPHAVLAGVEYSRRILLKMIFNIITGEEEAATMPEGAALPEDIVVEGLDAIRNCNNGVELLRVYKDRYKVASDNGDQATMKAYIAAKEKRKKELASDNR